MEKCPACQAPFKGRPQCHRCKTDLEQLLKIEAQAQAYQTKALACLTANDYAGMRDYAQKSRTLKKSPQASQLLRYSDALAPKKQD